jgi:hypothetical protein
VLRDFDLIHARGKREWRRLAGKKVQIHLSVGMSKTDLVAGHKRGELVSVLVFASTVPFVYNGTARYLILRRMNSTGRRWERIGRLAMRIEESEMEKLRSSEGLKAGLPVTRYGRDIVMI